MKTNKQYEEEISSLNFLLLEQKDHINALTNEKDRCKSLLEDIAKNIVAQANVSGNEVALPLQIIADDGNVYECWKWILTGEGNQDVFTTNAEGQKHWTIGNGCKIFNGNDR